MPPAGEVLAIVRPAAVALHRREPEGSPRNVWRTTVDDLEGDASRVRVRLRAPAGLVAEVTPAAVGELGLAPGASVYATVKATDVAVYPA
jgi:molybdate transport system ATP-binding protein